MIAYNAFPIACLAACVYLITIDRNGWAICFFILAVVSAVKPKTK